MNNMRNNLCVLPIEDIESGEFYKEFLLTFNQNNLLKNTLIKSIILLSITLIVAVLLGITLSHLNNVKEIDNLLETKQPSLPSILLDKNGEIITEFYSDEKRDLITLDIVPEYLTQGLILWEDEGFYHHRGFDLWAIFRASINNIIGKAVSGASTLTQQLARTLFLSHKFTWNRKFRELWIAIQLEKKYTKNEILALYLNHVPLGYGINGIGAASRFYFDKDIEDINYAESASLITVISNPTLYSFIRFPKYHKQKQKDVLKKMVKEGIITELEAENSFNEFWLHWQSTTHTARGAFYNREDKAPFFSDWVLNKITIELPNVNVFRDGLIIHSTLDIKWNQLAESLFAEVLAKQQKYFEAEQIKTYNIIQNYFIDTINLMGEAFSLSNINIDKNREAKRGVTEYNKDINPALNLTSQLLGLNLVDTLTEIMFNKKEKSKDLLSQVQGAFVVLDNETGHIVTMVGGKQFDPNNRFNYAMQSSRQPGSAFKPFVYSAALDTKMITPATIIMDRQHVFTFDSDDPDDWYAPYNYGARYYGKVNVRKALRRSLNIPACKVFYTIGKNNNYKVPIDRAAMLLGINSQAEIDKRFKPEISTALGTCSVSPVEMASAFSVFANLGKRIIPNSIIYIEDRDGRIIYKPWKELQKYYRENNKKLQVISSQNAYIVTSILKESISSPDGTLARVRQNILDDEREFPSVEFAGKTGTTQNWSDAWVIGYSPVITAAGWVGFDKYGLSLGYEQPGARVVGPIWMEYMRQYHENMENIEFKKPDRLITIQVCRESGMLPSDSCDEQSLYFEYFIPGTEPKTECMSCKQDKIRIEKNIDSFTDVYEKNFDKSLLKNLFNDEAIKVDRSILDEFKSIDDDLTIDEELIKIDLFDDDENIIDDIDIVIESIITKNDNNREKNKITDDTTNDITNDITNDNDLDSSNDLSNKEYTDDKVLNLIIDNTSDASGE